VCLITLAGIERFLANVSISKLSFHCVSTNALSSARSIAVRLFDLVAPFIKRPHLSAVSFLKNELHIHCANTGLAERFAKKTHREPTRLD